MTSAIRRLPIYNDEDHEPPCMKKNDLKLQVAAAIQACLDKKAEELSILEMEKGSAFTDYFVLCSGTNPRQVQAIADEVELRLKTAGLRPAHVEGYRQAEWILVDYVDFVVHVFSEKARKFYDLERLWKTAKRLEPSELKGKPPAKAASRTKTKTKTKVKTRTKTMPRRRASAPPRRKKA
jgi:ribosome-associated protein